MKKYQFSYRPELVTNEGSGVLICFGVEEVVVPSFNMFGEESTSTIYEAYAVRLQHPITHSRVVDAIVTAAYPNDVMQAITNNHMLNDGNASHEAEYVAMQEWRNLAKATADEVLGYNKVSVATYAEEPQKLESLGNAQFVYRWDIAEVVVVKEEEPTQEDIDSIIVRDAVAIEEVELPEEPTTEEAEETTEEAVEPQTEWKCKEVKFKLPTSVETIAKIVASESSEDYEAIYNEVGLVVIPLDMEAAKKELEEKIWAYDKQTEEFFIGGVSVWLNREERQTILRRCDAEEAKGLDRVVLRKNGMKFELPIATCRAIVLDVEFYASRCWDNREDLLVAKDELTTAEEILSFDVSSGYPEKLSF